MIVVSDASPLNVLVRIGHVDVLRPLFKVADRILEEALERDAARKAAS
ncbi:MAG: hypothetical protein HY718_08565 [Planctomycetes bacterium]|nr:hypothetical protein [Planctomycetota bacterium]